MLVACYTREDGGLSVVVPAPAERLNGESEDDFARRIADKDVPPGVAYTLLDGTALPASRRWRGAWRLAAGLVGVDVPAARLLRRAELLAERDRRLPLVRAKIERAEDEGLAVPLALLRARRRNLRGLEATLDGELASAATPEALDAYTPAVLQTED